MNDPFKIHTIDYVYILYLVYQKSLFFTPTLSDYIKYS